MTVIVEDLALIRLALELAVDQLTKGETVRVETEQGPVRRTLSPLLMQVADAVGSDQREPGAFTPVSKPPLRLDAVDLLREVDAEVRCRYSRGRLARVQAWAGAAHAVLDRDTLELFVEQAEEWVRRARALLEPTPPWPLWGMACPECGAAYVEATDSGGDPARRPALEVDRREGMARCLAAGCDGRWAPHAWEQLAARIGRQTV